LNQQKEHSQLPLYLFAAIAPALVAAVTRTTWPFLEKTLVPVFLLTVMIAAWRGGLGPGLLATLVSCLLSTYFFVEPYYSLRIASWSNVVLLVVIGVVGLCLSVMSELTHRMRRRAELNVIVTRRAEEALRQAQARTESVLASVADCHAVLDRQWRIVYVNDAAVRAIGQSREQILKQTLWQAFPDALGSELEKSVRRTMDERVPVTFEFHYESADTWWHNRIYPAAEGVALFGTNITEGKKAAQELREVEEKYRDIFENAEEGIFQSTPEGQYLVVNPALARMHGVQSQKELLGYKDISRDVYVDPGLRDVFKKLLEEQGSVRGFEHQIFRRDGSKIWVSVNARAVRNEAGEVVYYEGTVQDITRRKETRAALQESEERYRALFENSKDALYVHDLSGTYISVNRAAEELSGYSRAEIIGKNFADFIAPQHLPDVQENLCRKLEIEGETMYETETITKDGRRIPVEVSSRLIYEHGIAVSVQGTARDITDRKRAQKALRIYSQRLIEAQEAERQSVARELHDEVGQVLTAVKINLHSIQNNFETVECMPRIEEGLGIVEEALAHVRELSFNLRPALLDDLGLTAALRWYLDRYAQRTGMQTELLSDFDGERLPRELETACFRIAQEALTNIARHAQATKASIRFERSNGDLLLTVVDNGVGFDVNGFDQHGASALGLRGMMERAQAIGGAIAMHSRPAKGTEIQARLPIKPLPL
jgi:PAS domain S-box-containing protein